MGGQPEVEQDAVGLEGCHSGQGFLGGERRREVADARFTQPGAGGCDGLGVSVDRQDFRAALSQQRGVAAAADRGIHGAATACRPCAHCLRKHRDVIARRGLPP